MEGTLTHVPTADVPLLSALQQQASGAHATHNSFPDEDDLTSSGTYRSESRETTAEFSDYIETQSRWAWLFCLLPLIRAADLDPGSGMIRDPGAGMGKKLGSGSRIRIRDEQSFKPIFGG